jgi:hypothetical protein
MFGWLKRNRSPQQPDQLGSDAPATAAELQDELLSAYLDGDLTAQQQRDIEARLVGDPGLREALDGMRLVRDTLTTLEVVRAPRSFAIPVPDTASSHRPRFAWFDVSARVGAMAAAVLFAVLLTGDLTGSSSSDTPTTLDSTESFQTTALSANDNDAAAGDGAIEESAGAAEAATDASGDDEGAPLRLATDVTPDATPEPAAADTATAEPTMGAQALQATASPGTAVDDPAQAPAPQPGAATDSGADAAGDGAADAGGVGGGTEAADPGDQVDTPTPGTPSDAAVNPADTDAAVGGVDARATDADAPSPEAGTGAPSTSLATQPGETSAPAAAPQAGNLLDDDGGGLSALTVALGAITAVLAAVSGLLWWRRRDGVERPV